MRIFCPRGHLIAPVTINENGHVVPRDIRRSGLTWGHAPNLDHSCIRAKCPRCKDDGSIDYVTLCADVAAAQAAGHTEHRLTF